MIIPNNTVLAFEGYDPLKILGRDPFFSSPAAIAVVQGGYSQPHKELQFSGEGLNFSGPDAQKKCGRWISDNGLYVISEEPRELALADGLVSLVKVSHRQATAAFIRGINFYENPKRGLFATLHAALYK